MQYELHFSEMFFWSSHQLFKTSPPIHEGHLQCSNQHSDVIWRSISLSLWKKLITNFPFSIGVANYFAFQNISINLFRSFSGINSLSSNINISWNVFTKLQCSVVKVTLSGKTKFLPGPDSFMWSEGEAHRVFVARRRLTRLFPAQRRAIAGTTEVGPCCAAMMPLLAFSSTAHHKPHGSTHRKDKGHRNSSGSGNEQRSWRWAWHENHCGPLHSALIGAVVTLVLRRLPITRNCLQCRIHLGIVAGTTVASLRT